MHGTVGPQVFVCPETGPQRLFEAACPGPVDCPHRARLNVLEFWVQSHWGRWVYPRRCFDDLRWNGKISRHPDSTWDTTVALGLDEVLCRKLDYKTPKAFFESRCSDFSFSGCWRIWGLGQRGKIHRQCPSAKIFKNTERALRHFIASLGQMKMRKDGSSNALRPEM
jgi:hypothetical protein